MIVEGVVGGPYVGGGGWYCAVVVVVVVVGWYVGEVVECSNVSFGGLSLSMT